LTTISAGTLLAANNSALGQAGWSSSSKTDVSSGATLALQGGISSAEHMHVVGAGVGGLGAIRSLSGDNTLSMTNANSGSGPGLALDGNTTIGVDADKLTVTGFYHDPEYAGAGLTKVGNGTLAFSQTSTYTGNTTITGGTLQIGTGGASGALYSPSVSSGNLTFGSAGAIVNNGALVYNIAGGSVNVNKTISGTGTLNVTGNRSVHFANGTSISTTGSQTYSATATSGRYYGFNLADNATVTLTSTAGDISMTGMIGTSNFHTGNLVINTSAGNGNVTLNTPVGVIGVDYGMNSMVVDAGTGTISLGTHNGQTWGTVYTISLTGGAILSTANLRDYTTLTVNHSAASSFSGNLTGGGALVKTGAGTLTLSGNNAYTGATTLNAGLVVIQNGSAIGDASAVTINNSAQLRMDAGESIGSLAGNSAAASLNLQSHTLQIGDQLGSATVSYDGLISGSGGLVRRGGGTQTLTGNNSFSGPVTVMDGGTLSVPSVSASGNQPLGSGTGNISLDGAGGGATLAITGAGTYTLPPTRGLALSGTGGILNISAGTVNMTGSITGASNSAHFTKAGGGTFNFSGSAPWSADFNVSGGTFNLTGGGVISGVGVTTVGSGTTLNINTTGSMQTASIDILSGGTVNLDAGTLRVGGGGLSPTGRSIDNDSGSFNWGNGTLAVYTTGSGEAGLTDRTGAGGSPSGPAVKEGNYLSVAGSLNAPSGSTLDLGTTYLSNGLRYNQLNVDGNLTLNDGTLNIGLSPYFLRPNTPDSVTVGDWGTMVLVYAEGNLSGTFAQLGGKTVIPGISNDGIGWTQLADREYLGGPAFNPATLGMNEWLIEYLDGSDGNDFNFTQSPGAVVLLHYKVAGSVPEPASAGLLVAGALLLRALRRRKE
jgi:fibronectin-binding autotransporter adhesin